MKNKIILKRTGGFVWIIISLLSFIRSIIWLDCNDDLLHGIDVCNNPMQGTFIVLTGIIACLAFIAVVVLVAYWLFNED